MPPLTSAAPTAESSVLDLFLQTERVRGQEKARKQLAVLLDRQRMVADGLLPRAGGAILAGRTGSGKTYLARMMCRACGLPFAEVNATQYTDKGYVGLDLAQMFLPLLEEAARMYDQRQQAQRLQTLPLRAEPSILKRSPRETEAITALASSGVVLLDEFDKWMIQSDDQGGRNVGKKLMAELLKMVEGSTEYVTDSEEELGIAFDTSRVLILCAGAFVGLQQQVIRRLHRDEEFMHDDTMWDLIEPTDFVRYGLLPELAGRLSTHIFIRPLKEEHLVEIMCSQGGPVDEYRARFEAHGCGWDVPEQAIRYMAHVALERETGARGVDHVLWQAFGEALFEAATVESPMVVQMRPNDHRARLVAA